MPLYLLSSHALRLTSLKWSNQILFSHIIKWTKRYKYKYTIVNDLYHASLISAFAVGYSMLGKKIDLKDMGKLVAIVAVSEMNIEYLIKQKILPERINVYKWRV